MLSDPAEAPALPRGQGGHVLLVLAPGQGAQAPGLLRPWLAAPGAASRVARWSDLTGLDLARLGTTADDDEIRDTAVAQPLLVTAALLSAPLALGGRRPDLVCGHSVGELSAAAVAGVLGEDDAVLLAAQRGAAMAAAAAARPTGMVAVLGGDPGQVRQSAERLGLELATVNVSGQLVFGGPVPALEALAAAPPARARVRRLAVAGAFHTSHMTPAVPALATAVARLNPRDPVCPVVANADGALVTDGRELLKRLVGQLTGPVRFDSCLAACEAATEVVELAPSGVLAALARRALPAATVRVAPESVPA